MPATKALRVPPKTRPKVQTGEGLHLLDDLHPGDLVPWQNTVWTVYSIRGTVLTLQSPDGKKRRLDWAKQDVGAFYRDMDSLWSLTKPHCYGQPKLCGWCQRGFYSEADTEKGGAIAKLHYHLE